MSPRKLAFIYTLAIIMLVFGTAGSGVFFGGLFVVKDFNLSSLNFESINNSVQEGTGSVNTLIKDTSTAMANVSKTVREVKNTLRNVSTLSKAASEATYGIAKSMNFEIFTVRPLGDTVKYFNDIGDSLSTLSESIEDTAGTFDKNADDIDRIALDMEDISEKIESASNSFAATATSLPDLGFKKILYALLAYAGMLHLMFVLIGISLMMVSKSSIAAYVQSS
jgi:methyl-accepting chemotaxis protein